MAKVRIPHEEWVKQYGPGHEEYLFMCPGCKSEHRFIVKWGGTSGRDRPSWTFNGDMDKPTFNPSLLMQWQDFPTDEEHARIMAGEKVPMKKHICHLFVRGGLIEFLSDSTHELAGKIVEIPEVKSICEPRLHKAECDCGKC